VAESSNGPWTNWGRNQSCRPALLARPDTEDHVRETLATAAERGLPVKVAGSGHSFSDIALTDGVMISLQRYARVLEVDAAAGTVTVQAGITLKSLTEALDREGQALPILGEVLGQAIAGAIATGTHGTGARSQSLSAAVRSLRLVLADGSVLECSAASDLEAFRAAQVGLGALGVVSTVTLRCVPAFNLHTVVRRGRVNDVMAALPDLVDAHDHVDVIWFPHTDRVRLRHHDRTSEPEAPRSKARVFLEDRILENDVFGALGSLGKRWPSMIPSLNRFMAGGVREVDLVDRSFRRFTTPRLTPYVEMEYAMPRAVAADALRDVADVLERRGLRLSFPVQVRFAAADDSMLSPSTGRDTCFIGVHEFSGRPYEDVFRAIESVLVTFDGRPHWGKVHWMTAETLRPRYPDWDRFQAVRARLDPAGRFRNAYLDRVLGVG
jgi:L-gulonolactone oxidase